MSVIITETLMRVPSNQFYFTILRTFIPEFGNVSYTGKEDGITNKMINENVMGYYFTIKGVDVVCHLPTNDTTKIMLFEQHKSILFNFIKTIPNIFEELEFMVADIKEHMKTPLKNVEHNYGKYLEKYEKVQTDLGKANADISENIGTFAADYIEKRDEVIAERFGEISKKNREFMDKLNEGEWEK